MYKYMYGRSQYCSSIVQHVKEEQSASESSPALATGLTQNVYHAQYAYPSLDRNNSRVKDLAGRFQKQVDEASHYLNVCMHIFTNEYIEFSNVVCIVRECFRVNSYSIWKNRRIWFRRSTGRMKTTLVTRLSRPLTSKRPQSDFWWRDRKILTKIVTYFG